MKTVDEICGTENILQDQDAQILHAKKYGLDVHKILEGARQKERAGDRTVLSHPRSRMSRSIELSRHEW